MDIQFWQYLAQHDIFELILGFQFFFCIHIALYSIILFCVFLWIPFVYFYYEERDDDNVNKCSVRMHLPSSTHSTVACVYALLRNSNFHPGDSGAADQYVNAKMPWSHFSWTSQPVWGNMNTFVGTHFT